VGLSFPSSPQGFGTIHPEAHLWEVLKMRIPILPLLAALLLTGVLAACGSDTPASTPTPVATVAPTPTSAPTATSMFAPTSTPAPTVERRSVGVPTSETTKRDDPGANSVLKLLGSDPPTLDPHQTGDVTSSRYILEVFGGLLTIDPDLAIVPDIAQNWEIDTDGMGYTFRLNPSVTFHDGRKVTASDVQFSLERASDPATESPAVDTFLGDIVGVKAKLNGEADSISGVSVVDEETLRIETDAPKSYFLSKLTYPSSFVVDRANVEIGREWVKAPNGTGPFMLAEYDPGVLMRLERFDDYHLGPAMIDAVEFNLAGGDGLLMYENDELHVGRVGLAGLAIFGDPTNPLHGEFHQGPPEFDVAYIGMNTSEPPFDDVNIRLALNYAIDRETLSEVLLENVVVPAKGILPPGFPGYNSDLPGYDYDPEKARRLLAESKYGSDTANYPPITITLPGSFGSTVDPVTQAILATWEEQLGIKMDLLQTEWATYLQDLRDRRFQIFGGLGWIADYPDPENFLDGLFHTGSDNNHTHYSDPELDALLERARVEQDQEARFALYQEAEQMILEGAPWAPLYHSNGEFYLIKPHVKGWPLSPLVIPRFRFVYIEE
jgi:ABC-type transport system substrate-binding protein